MDKSKIKRLSLQNFRGFPSRDFSFGPQVLILGNNGRGKTNILEAISLLSTGRSFQGNLLSECVRLGTDVAHVGATIEAEDEDVSLSLSIVSSTNNLGVRASTRYKRNGVKKTKTEVVGVLKSVVFRPEDMDLVVGSPARRRSFLDEVLVQVSPKYASALRDYEKALRHRNKLILKLREGEVTRRDFVFWDELLIRQGDVLTRQRKDFLGFLNNSVLFPMKIGVTYDHSLMTEERLHKYAVAEVAAGKTLVGPHKDTLITQMVVSEAGDLQDVSHFGSRGQQRLAVLWLKMGALKYIEAETGVSPVLLLDDIFSELDDTNREIIFPLFVDHQVIMTSAEQLKILPSECQQGVIINLE